MSTRTQTPGTPHSFGDGLAMETARKFQKLAALRGISCDCHFSTTSGHYVINGEDCGPSIHGCYDWLDRQPGVKK